MCGPPYVTACVLLTSISSCECLWSITPTCNHTCTTHGWQHWAHNSVQSRCNGRTPILPMATTQDVVGGSGAEARLLPGNTPPFYPPAILLAGRRAMTSKGATLWETDGREGMSRNKPTAICPMRLSGIHEEVKAWEARMWISSLSYELWINCQDGQMAFWGWNYSYACMGVSGV
jgi:hypothetical protein